MDEYLNYLNTVKNFQHVEEQPSDTRDYYKNNSSSRRSHQTYKPYDSYHKKKRYSRDYKDLDEPEVINPSATNSNRNLISYDDL